MKRGDKKPRKRIFPRFPILGQFFASFHSGTYFRETLCESGSAAMLSKREGGFLRREVLFLRRGGGFLRSFV